MLPDTSPGKRAPEPLKLVQRFVNSVDLEDAIDDLSTAQALHDWLVEFNLLESGTRVTDGDLRRALDVREGLRALFLANNGEPHAAEAIERLDRAARRAGLYVRFHPDGGVSLEPDATGVDGAIARLMAIVAEARIEGTLQRLKACAHDSCQWAFYDHSKNRSGRWCSMEVCGNVEKARAFRDRRRGAKTRAARHAAH